MSLKRMLSLSRPISVDVNFSKSKVVRDRFNFSSYLSLRGSKVLRAMLVHLGVEIVREIKLVGCQIL